MKNIVIIGGGTGTFTLLAGIRKFPVNNSVIVSSADDGGSTGMLRRDIGVMPMGDIRQCLVGLSYTEDAMRQLFSYRFEHGALTGHAAGNIILAALQKTSGSVESAIGLAAKMLNVRGEVLPATLFPTVLEAVYGDGDRVRGEHLIDEPKKTRRAPIVSLALHPSAPANPRALAAIKKADAIVFGPGDLFTSILPNVIVKGMRECIASSRAKKILITNIMTKQGQTDGFRASDFVRALNPYLATRRNAHPIDIVIVNNKKPGPALQAYYRREKAQFVKPDIQEIKKLGITTIAADLVSLRPHQRAPGDTLKRSFLRHDSDKTAKIIWQLLS